MKNLSLRQNMELAHYLLVEVNFSLAEHKSCGTFPNKYNIEKIKARLNRAQEHLSEMHKDVL